MEPDDKREPAPIPVTVVMRSYNDAPLLPRTLSALDAQRGVEVRLAVFESASSDGSPEIFEAHGYARMTSLKPGEYRSSKVLNLGVREADTEVVCFLNSDAVLEGDGVLRALAERLLAKGDTAGVFARQVVRADAGFLTRLEYEQAFDRRAELGRAARWMTLVCSAVRRSVWEQVPFDERLTFAEDAVWSEAVMALGYETVYVADAAAEHSHEYTPAQRYRRAYGDAAALAALPDAGEPPRGVLAGFWIPWLKRSIKTALRCSAKGKPWMAPVAAAHLRQQLRGEWHGARAGWDHFHGAGGGAGEQPVFRG